MKLNLGLAIGRLKGVGPSVEAKLARLKIYTLSDLLTHYPRRYDDFSHITKITAMKPGLITVKGKVLAAASRKAFRRPLTVTEAIISDGTGTVKAIWFNQPFIKNSLIIGTEVYVSGRLEFKNNDLALQSPTVEDAGKVTKDTGRIVPIYPETSGLTSKQIRGILMPIMPLLADLPETLPPETIKKAKLLSFGEALKEIHFPSSTAKLEQARRRIAFEEVFYLVAASLSLKKEIKTETAPIITFDAPLARAFTESLPFKLTDAQRQAAWQILQDVERDKPMNRLLEGDVGSGKTVVAAMAAVMAMGSGFQVALMVPTEILARQHLIKLQGLIKTLGFKAGLYVGKQTAAEKRQILSRVKSGEVDLIIGTHALFSDPVEFLRLGLVIIDEQHRFGVGQRQALKQKAGYLPHLLSMTATPIPRSLALTVYGDLDISIIDALPPGRTPITTKIVANRDRDKVYAKIDEQIAAGRQVYLVCPLIEESDKTGSKSVTAEAERLQKTIFSHRRIGLMHGKLSSVEKQNVMREFVLGKIDILVSTTVIEVGVDVPNASIMLIDGADRFGLAALHQLRGRVGRGEHKSYCYLFYDSYSPGVAERLKAMERTNDGFRLAQIDLELRGPGQIYGLRQHGTLDLQMANITDVKLIAEVKKCAEDFLRKPESMLKYPMILQKVSKLKTVTSLD